MTPEQRVQYNMLIHSITNWIEIQNYKRKDLRKGNLTEIIDKMEEMGLWQDLHKYDY